MVQPILKAESHDCRIQNIHCQILFNPQTFIPTKIAIKRNDSGHVVLQSVDALRYRPEGREFDYGCCH